MDDFDFGTIISHFSHLVSSFYYFFNDKEVNQPKANKKKIALITNCDDVSAFSSGLLQNGR